MCRLTDYVRMYVRACVRARYVYVCVYMCVCDPTCHLPGASRQTVKDLASRLFPSWTVRRACSRLAMGARVYSTPRASLRAFTWSRVIENDARCDSYAIKWRSYLCDREQPMRTITTVFYVHFALTVASMHAFGISRFRFAFVSWKCLYEGNEGTHDIEYTWKVCRPLSVGRHRLVSSCAMIDTR